MNWKLIEGKVSFNSKMVRLKEPFAKGSEWFVISFNSKMVRLKETENSNDITRTNVSIPKWYD